MNILYGLEENNAEKMIKDAKRKYDSDFVDIYLNNVVDDLNDDEDVEDALERWDDQYVGIFEHPAAFVDKLVIDDGVQPNDDWYDEDGFLDYSGYYRELMKNGDFEIYKNPRNTKILVLDLNK